MNWNQWGQELNDYLYEKMQALGICFVISEEMKNALENHDIKRVIATSDRRGCIIESIKRLDKRITELTKEKIMTAERLPQCVKDMIGPLVKKIEDALRSLVEIDRTCLALAMTEHEVRKNDLLRMRTGLSVAKGYGARGKIVPRFLDIKK